MRRSPGSRLGSKGRGELLRYGYITNGLADHTLEQAVEMLATAGYQGIGITLDHQHLDPSSVDDQRLAEIGALLRSSDLEPVIETGARFALDPKRKHWPSMVSADADDRKRRIDYYRRAIQIADALGARVVSLWSGVAEPGSTQPDGEQSLVEALGQLLPIARECGVTIGFEPEPGMLIESLEQWCWLRQQIADETLRLTVDLGHLAITEASPLEAALRQVVSDVVHVHVDDCARGVHEHLPLGTGELDFASLLRVLIEHGYSGLALVELSRDSHRAPELIDQSIRFLQGVEADLESSCRDNTRKGTS